MPQTGVWCQALELERAMGIGPTVSSLARKRFTGKLRPLNVPSFRIELKYRVLQTRALTALASSAYVVAEGLEPPALRM